MHASLNVRLQEQRRDLQSGVLVVQEFALAGAAGSVKPDQEANHRPGKDAK
jgi:hypothetical protein